MDLYLQSLSGLLVVVGPWKAAIVFAEQTSAMKVSTRRLTAAYTVGIATVVGLLFIFAGRPILEFFHISDAAFLIGAGLIVIVFSIGMVINPDQDDAHQAGPVGKSGALSLAVFPLSMPLIITPPGIATLVSLGVLARINDQRLFAIVAAFGTVMVINLAVLVFESRYAAVINPAVFHVAGRLLGVLLVAFGVSIGIDGLKELDLLTG